MIEIYTDGSYRASTETGGYGLVVLKQENEVTSLLYAYQEQIEKVTNNQMELKAIIEACKYADANFANEPVIIYSDSSYCVKSINEWMHTWVKNGWINSKKETVKNLDLMKTLYSYFNQDFYHCQVCWNKGHNGAVGNELADALATNDMNKFVKEIQKNSIQILYRPK